MEPNLIDTPCGQRDPATREDLQTAPIQDLRQWIERVEQMGELIRVRLPVSRDEEMSAISYLVAKQQPSPAVLFEHPSGFEKSPIGARLLWNVLGLSRKRIALTLEEPVDTPTLELIRRVKDKLKRRTRPREVARDRAPVYANTLSGSRDRPRPLADSQALAAGRRALCGHRGRGHHARPGQRLSEHRDLPDDAAGQIRGRPVSVAGQAPQVRAFEQESSVVYHETGGFEPGHQARKE